MLINDIERIFDTALANVNFTESEIEELVEYTRITRQQFFNLGYFCNSTSWQKLNLPDGDIFNIDVSTDKYDEGLIHLFQSFAWRGFMTYCQPIINDMNELTGFSYCGTTTLDEDVAECMLRFPSPEWIDNTLIYSDIDMSEELSDMIMRSRTSWAHVMEISAKRYQARIFSLLHLLDIFPFIQQTYNSKSEQVLNCYTRSPDLIRQLVADKDIAESMIGSLTCDDAFDAPLSGELRAVKLIPIVNGDNITYTAEMDFILIDAKFDHLIPYFQFKAYCDGITQRIDDMANKAGHLVIDYQDGLIVNVCCTASAKVYKSVYSELLGLHEKPAVFIGLDPTDFHFKLLNLQSVGYAASSIISVQPFTIRKITSCSLDVLTANAIDNDYALVRSIFLRAIGDVANHLPIAKACGIATEGIDLTMLLQEFVENTHPKELYKIIVHNRKAFASALA